MRDKIEEFSEFYKELNQNVSDLRHKLLILCKSEQIERERLEAAKKARPQRPTAKKPNLPSTPAPSSAAPDAPKGGAASMLDPEFLKTLTPDERELLETLSPEELQQLSGTMSSEAPVPSPLPNLTRPQAKPSMPLKTQYHMDVPQSFNPGFAGAPFASSQPVQNSGLYNNALLDTLTPDERRLLLGEDVPVVNNNPSNSSMASSRNAVASRSTVMGAAYHGATQQVDNQNPVLQQQMQVVQKPLAQNIPATAAAVNTAGHQNIHSIAPVGQQWPVNYHGTNATNPASSSVFQTNQNTYQPVVQDLSKGPQVVSNGHQNPNNQFGQYNATGNSSSLPTTHNQYQYSPQSSLNYATNPSVTAQSQFLTPHSHNQFMPVQNNVSNYGFAPERQHVPQMWNNQGSAIAAAPRSLTPNSNGPSSLEMSREHVAILEQMKQQQTFLMQQLEVQNKRQAELEKQLADQRMSHQMELQRQEKAKEREHEKVMLEQQVLLQEQINRQKALEKQLEEQNLQQQQILSQVWNVASLTQNYQQQLDQLRNRAISEKQPNTQNVSESVQLPETNVAATTFRNQPTSLPQDYTANQNYSPVPQNLHSNAPVSVQTAAPMYGNYQGMHSIPNSLSSSQSEPTRASVQSVPTTMDDSSKEVSQYVAMYDPKKPMDPKVLSALMKQQSQQKPLVFPNSQQQQGAQMTQNVSQNYSGVQMNSNITNNQPPTSHSNVPISYQQSVVATDSQSINGNNLANNVVQNASTSNISMQHPNAQANWYYGHGVASHNSEKRSNSVDQSLGHCESPVLKNHEVKHNPTVDSSPTHNSRAFNSSLQPNQPINQVKVDPTPVLQPNATVVSSNTSKSTDSEGGVVEPSVKVEAGDINGARRSESQSPSPAIIEQHMPVVMSSNSVPADDNKSVSDQETRLPPSNEVSQVINSIIKRSPVVRNSPLRKSSVVLPNADQFISKLVSDVEKLEKHLANIHKRTLNGPTILEREWEDLENKFVKNCSTCKEKSDLKLAENVPSLNSAVRTSECFVGNAVVRSVYPDQIGGSKMVVVDVDMEFGLVPRFLLLGSESSDSDESMKLFWEMVSESDISLIVSFSGRNQLCPYMPTMQGVNVSIGKDLFLRLQNTSISQYWLQRTVNLFSPAQNTNRSVTHLQFLEWPSVDCCENSSASELFPKHAPFLSFVRTVRHFYSLQSNYNQPVLLLCRDGITQSGILMLLLKCMQCIDHGFGMTDVSTEINAIRHFHQAIVTSPNQMFFLYICYLHYIQQFLSTTKANQTCSYQVINSPSPYGLPSLQPISTKTTFSEETNSNSMQANNDSEDKSGNAANGVRDLRALMSADNFSVGSRSGSPKGPKRHNFDDATFKIGQESNPNDPFSSLDPLWKMK